MVPKNLNNTGMKKLSFLAVILLAGMWSCQWETIVPEEIIIDGSVSYATDIAPVFDTKCTGCHGGGISPNLMADKSWSELTSKGLVVPGDLDGSELMSRINADHGATLSLEEKALVTKWIEDGAENN